MTDDQNITEQGVHAEDTGPQAEADEAIQRSAVSSAWRKRAVVAGGAIFAVATAALIAGGGIGQTGDSASGDAGAAESDTADTHSVLATLETRLEALDRELDGLNNQIRGLADDYGELLDQTRRFQEELKQQGEALDVAPKPERVASLEQEINDLRATTDELTAMDDDHASATDLAAVAERVNRLEQAPETPELNGALVTIDHWGNSALAVLNRNGRTERLRRGERIGAWRLESLDANAGVAVFRHPAGHTTALAVED
ncbi:hypothetical protein [Aquisalimonas asiatica]|uniref:Uncharacterized protein n=1 Tax=Aquisalimonas asiatica TaxID=406100 RepID=A0A1H8T268_9GAMM|nr:hypothetical protein [Aquisalimonas asiatica]SEO85022.1 hypothetical protein SAMN04488052_103367 [Aquisalimonas asiatica]